MPQHFERHLLLGGELGHGLSTNPAAQDRREDLVGYPRRGACGGELFEEGVADELLLCGGRLCRHTRSDLAPSLVLLAAVALADVEQDVGRHRSGSARGVGADAFPCEPDDVVDRVVVAPDTVGKVAQTAEQSLEQSSGREMISGRQGCECPSDRWPIVGVEAEVDHVVEVCG